ncbi:hypothetical protein [Pseudarthrobacter sp. AB1]|uniref:hypothetical protein n=1 Tax=Pseudarthrobacter sp. AB1 TaxID=2138309 RepID=UPI001D045B2A|nr:hypothetical protein [Pseudarthrobacter sp. AB1]
MTVPPSLSPTEWTYYVRISATEKQEITMSDVTVVIGGGSIGQATARRVDAG